MTEPKCPDCHHFIKEHAEFFCMHPNCYCNTSRATSLARYERDIALKKLECAKDTLKDIVTIYSISDVAGMAEMALKEIDKIGA